MYKEIFLWIANKEATIDDYFSREKNKVYVIIVKVPIVTMIIQFNQEIKIALKLMTHACDMRKK